MSAAEIYQISHVCLNTGGQKDRRTGFVENGSGCQEVSVPSLARARVVHSLPASSWSALLLPTPSTNTPLRGIEARPHKADCASLCNHLRSLEVLLFLLLPPLSAFLRGPNGLPAVPG